MELIGLLVFADGCYWICSEVEEWACPFGVGDRAEVLVAGQWQAVTMQSDDSHGCSLRLTSGRWLLPAQGMRVRVAHM